MEEMRVRLNQKENMSELGCEDGNWIGGVALVIVACPSKADAAVCGVNAVLWRNGVEELNEDKLFGSIVRRD